MKPTPFDLERPTRVEEVLELLALHGSEARLLAGGQTLVPLMNLRMVTPRVLVDLNRVEGLAGIRLEGDKVRIGAMTRQKELLCNPLVASHVPLAAMAIPHIGHLQTRSRGTIGGSLALADPAAELPVVMVALDATFFVRGHGSERTIAAREFFIDLMTTALAPGELLVEISIPAAPAGTRVAFEEFARRHGDFAIASCAAQLTPGARSPQLAVALGGVGTRPHYCRELVAALAAVRFSRATLAQAVDAEVEKLSPLSDLHADAKLRRQLARVALKRCLDEVLR